MKRHFYVIGLVLLLLLATSCATVDVADGEQDAEPEKDNGEEETTTAEGNIEEESEEIGTEKTEGEEEIVEESATVEFDVTATSFEFIPSEITVSEGDTVILHVTSEDVDHGVAISAFGVSETVPAGETVDIEFVADEAGEYSIVCSVFCGSGHGSMTGTLIVE